MSHNGDININRHPCQFQMPALGNTSGLTAQTVLCPKGRGQHAVEWGRSQKMGGASTLRWGQQSWNGEENGKGLGIT